MSSYDQKVKLFLKGAGIKLVDKLEQKIKYFFKEKPEDKHIIFKRSILYFYNKKRIIGTITTKSIEKHVYTFDGTKVARIQVDYYVGGAESEVVNDAFLHGTTLAYSNNNNNNNNNNGNNNG